MLVAVSGGFDPLHIGHIELFKLAKNFVLMRDQVAGKLLVIVNKDDFLIKKKGYVFMPFRDRLEIVKSIKYVDYVMGAIDDDMTVCKTLEIVRPTYFINGGDRKSYDSPEKEVCEKFGITMLDGFGDKIRSSSDLVLNVIKQIEE